MADTEYQNYFRKHQISENHSIYNNKEMRSTGAVDGLDHPDENQ